jgi:hypothetical protein
MKMKKRQTETAEEFKRRADKAIWAESLKSIESVVEKTGMRGEGQSRNKKWRIAEMERRAFLLEDDNW